MHRFRDVDWGYELLKLFQGKLFVILYLDVCRWSFRKWIMAVYGELFQAHLAALWINLLRENILTCHWPLCQSRCCIVSVIIIHYAWGILIWNLNAALWMYGLPIHILENTGWIIVTSRRFRSRLLDPWMDVISSWEIGIDSVGIKLLIYKRRPRSGKRAFVVSWRLRTAEMFDELGLSFDKRFQLLLLWWRLYLLIRRHLINLVEII